MKEKDINKLADLVNDFNDKLARLRLENSPCFTGEKTINKTKRELEAEALLLLNKYFQKRGGLVMDSKKKKQTKG